MIEEFRDIVGYEGIYKVSNLGRVKSLARKDFIGRPLNEKILKNCDNGNGYLHILLSKDCKKKLRTIHQLVAEAFLGHVPCGMKLIVNHKNFIRHDNRAENLEIDTARNNTNRKHLKSSSEYTGVSWHKKTKKWTSQIVINGKKKYLGLFACELEAAKAYQKALNAL
jgi:hypothetical protein|tara:strand:- start:26 stop:526 length:501 start_codon:yes stop_codon:yes gene_type:complete